jgi:hypothetical protein
MKARHVKRVYSTAAVLVLVFLGAAPWSQAPAGPAREVLKSDRELSASEIAAVLSEVRREVAGKTLRLGYAPGGPGVEIRMGTDGRPRLLRTGTEQVTPQGERIEVVTITEYTAMPARSCGGASLDGNLVVEFEYFNLDKRWVANARTRGWTELGSPLFDILAGDTAVQAGELRQIGNRPARALVAPYTHPPSPPNVQIVDPLPQATMQSLWIDTASLLPLRWALALPAHLPAGPSEYGLWFSYDEAIDLQRPGGVAMPECVP